MSNKLSLPDTNTILRYLLDDELVLAARAREFWEFVRTGAKTAEITEGVMMEAVYVLQRFYKVPRNLIVENLTGLLTYKGLKTANIPLYQTSLRIYGDTALDFVDCLLAARSQAEGIEVITFDEKLNTFISKL